MRWLIMLWFLLGGCALGQSELRVVRHVPEGPVSVGFQIRVDFSEPVAALGENTTPPISLQPPVAGNWRWIHQRTLIFEPATVLPKATVFHVEIPAGVQSLQGARLSSKVSWSFSTSPPIVTYCEPDRKKPQGPNPEIVLRFDQPVEPKNVLPYLTLGDGVQTYSLMAGKLSERNEAHFSVLGPLPPQRQFTLQVRPGIPGLEGDLRSQSAQSFSFSTCGPLKVRDFRTWVGGCGFEFQQPLEKASVDQRAIRVSPPCRFKASILDQTNERYRTELRLDLPPGSYRVTLLPGALRDICRQTLEVEHSFQVKIPPLKRPAKTYTWIVHGRSGLQDVTLDADRPQLQVITSDFERLGVEVRGPGGERLKKWAIPDTGKRGFQVVTIDLAPFLNQGTGQLQVTLQPGNQDPVRMKVNVTHLAVMAWRNGGRTEVWVVSLRDGSPVPGARVELSAAPGVTETNSQGLACLPGEGQVTVCKGADRASTQAPAEPHDGGNHWAVLEPVGLYRPGETIRASGWLRDRADTDLPNRFELRPSDSLNPLATASFSFRPDSGFELQVPIPKDAPLGTYQLCLGQRSFPIEVAEFRIGAGLPEDRPQPLKQPPQQRISLRPLSPSARLGDMVEVEVESPFPRSTAVFTAQGRVLEPISWQGPKHRFRVLMNEDTRPSFSIQIHLMGRNAEGEWEWASSQCSVKVIKPKSWLDVQVRAQAQAAPGATLPLELQVRDSLTRGVACNLTVAVVDNALLARAGHNQADPLASFFPDLTWTPETSSATLQTKVQIRNLLNGLQEDSFNRPRFRSPTEGLVGGRSFQPLAFFESGLKTDETGHLLVPVPLPDDLTCYRVIVLAKAPGDRIGKGETTLTQPQRPLSVQLRAPRFLFQGDRLEVPITVFNRSSQPMEVTLKAVGNGIEADQPGSVHLGAEERREIFVPCLAQSVGKATLRVEARGGEGADACEVSWPVLKWSRPLTETRYEEISCGESRWLQAKGRWETTLQATPFWSWESMPGGRDEPGRSLLASLSLSVADPIQARLGRSEALKGVCNEILKREIQPPRNAELEVYYALAWAREEGDPVPTDALEASRRQLRNMLIAEDNEYMPGWSKLGAVPLLARLEGQGPEVGRFCQHFASDVEAWPFLLTGWPSGAPELRRKMLNRLYQDANELHYLRDDRVGLCYSSEFDTDAAFLLDLLDVPEARPLTHELARGLRRRWNLDYESARALIRYWRKEVDPNTRWEETPEFIQNNGPGTLFCRSTRCRSTTELRALQEGIRLERSFQSVDSPDDVRRDPAGHWRIRAGSRVRVVLEVSSEGSSRELIVRDSLPGALEALQLENGYQGARWGNLREHGVDYRLNPTEGYARSSYLTKASWPGQFLSPPAYAEGVDDPSYTGQSSSAIVIVERR
jgi:hypothetical protein